MGIPDLPDRPDIPDRVEGRFAELPFDECIRRLGVHHVGRLAVVVGHYPQVFPVNYRLDDDIVVFRTHLGTKLLAAHHANVSFQVDLIDESTHSGWSVLVLGMAEDVTDHTGDLAADRSRLLDVAPWAPGDKSRVVRIIPAHVTGRELHGVSDSYWPDERGYL